MPEPGTPVPRPRRPKPDASDPQPVSVSAPSGPLPALEAVGYRTTDAERRLHELVEDLHAATRALGLPPQSIRIGPREERQAEVDPEAAQLISRLDMRLAAMDTATDGPYPQRISEVRPPANPDFYLLADFIRPGTTVMMTGPPGASKSWASRQLALCAGAGLHHFLSPRYEVTRPLRVLIVDEDNGPDEEWRREETLLDYLELQRTDMVHVWRTSLEGVQLDQERWQQWLRGQILLRELDLVILDPISEMHGGEEMRKDPAFRSMLTFLKRLKVEFPQLAVVLVHHTRKAPSSDRGTTRGLDDVRGQWGQTPDVVALMWPLTDRRVQWELHKRVPHSKLILEATPTGPVQVVADESTVRDKRTSRDDRVLQAIEAGAENWEQVHHATDMSRTSIFNAVKSLRRAGLLTKREPYQLVNDPTDDPIGQSTGVSA